MFFSIVTDILISWLDYNAWSVGLYLSICLYWHIPQDCDVVFFCYCLGLMLVLLFSRLRLFSSLCRYSSVGMSPRCCVFVRIQVWPAQGTLPQYSQQFPEIEEKSLTLGLYHLLGSCYGSSWSCLKPFVGHLMVHIFLVYSFWVLSMHWLTFPALFQLILGMALCFFGLFWYRQLELRSQVPGKFSSLLNIVAWLATEYFFFSFVVVVVVVVFFFQK